MSTPIPAKVILVPTRAPDAPARLARVIALLIETARTTPKSAA